MNQLIEENNYKQNINVKYTYDINDGSFISQNKYEYTNNNWHDQLTKYNDVVISYDNVGNPINIGSATLSWIDGLILSSYNDNNLNVNYTYDRNGIRLSKTINGVQTKYYIEDKAVVRQASENEVIDFIRDENDDLVAFKYNEVYYFYEIDALGNISAILDNNCNIISEDLIKRFYYSNLRKDLAKLFRKYNDLRFCFCLPKCISSYELKEGQKNSVKIDTIANIVELNIENENYLNTFYTLLIDLAKKITMQEATYLVDSFFNSKTEEKIEEKLQISHTTLFKIRKSVLVKMLLQFKSQALI